MKIAHFCRQSLIGWKDPNQSYDFYNLIFDVPYRGLTRKRKEQSSAGGWADADAELNEGTDTVGRGITDCHPVFSIVKHYPPKWKAAKPSAHRK